MNGRWNVLRARPLLWGLPLAFVLLNLGIFVFYRVAYAGQVEALKRSYDSQSQVHQKLRGEREQLQRYLERLSSSSEGIDELYREHFGTEAQRLTQVRSEIKRLSSLAGLEPTALNYPRSDLEEIDLLRMGITFGVEGSYEQLRQLINLLELSDQFLALEEVSLNRTGERGSASYRLNINLRLSTIFATDELGRRAAEQARQNGAGDVVPASDVDQGDEAGADDVSDEVSEIDP